jgi:HAD superfamily hydrolase (TIGR01458 family)
LSNTGPPIRAVLLDLEGTIYAGGRALEGAARTLAELGRRGLGLRFLTNIDSRPPAAIAAELIGLGLELDPAHVFTPVSAAAAMLHAASLPGRPARVQTLLSTQLQDCIPHRVSEPPFTHVLVGDCRDLLDYSRLDAAFRAVHQGAELLALQRGRFFIRDDGDHIDTGAVVAGLEYAAGVTARVLGKPARDFFALAAADLGLDLTDCVVVGDDSTTDIRGGRDAGARTIQVRTGKYAAQAAEGLAEVADLTVDSIADLPEALDQLA